MRAVIRKAQAIEYEAPSGCRSHPALLPEQAVSQQQVDQADARWKVAVTEIAVAKKPPSTKPARNSHRLNWGRNVSGRRRRRSRRSNGNATKQMPRWRRLALCSTINDRGSDKRHGDHTHGGHRRNCGDRRALLKWWTLTACTCRSMFRNSNRQKSVWICRPHPHGRVPRRTLRGDRPYIASKSGIHTQKVQTPDERVKLIYAVRLYLTGQSESSVSHRGFRPTR